MFRRMLGHMVRHIHTPPTTSEPAQFEADLMADTAARSRVGRARRARCTALGSNRWRAGRLGDITWPIVRDKVDDVIVVSEEEIVDAMRLLAERLKVLVEPSGAVGLAAVLSPAFAARHGDVGAASVVLCGANADLESIGYADAWRARSRALVS